VDRGPLLESKYTACSTQLTTGLACTLSITRENMEHGGRLPANSALTVYYLPVYPPYNDYNYGLRGHLNIFGGGFFLYIIILPVFVPYF
jgi:hypothetical protein